MQRLTTTFKAALISAVLLLSLLPAGANAATANTTDNKNCVNQTRVLDVVAHQDDDLLFINPDIQSHIRAGDCVETVYLTAGDAGNGAVYWQKRESGIHAAYAHMSQSTNKWSRTRLTMNGKQIVRDKLLANPKVTVMFMRLPDGKIDGSGFATNGHQSLKKLWKGNIDYMRTKDGSTHYSKQSLIRTLAAIIQSYQPKNIRTLNTNGSFGDGDHTDHVATAYFTQAAVKETNVGYPLYSYKGYPISAKKANLTAEQSNKKQDTFFVYERTVGGICQTTSRCGWKYGAWLSRRYEF